MVGPMENRAVVRWIQAHAKRPRVSAALWAECFCHLRTDTGQIILSRGEMAEAVGCTPAHISEALSELAGIGAVIRRQDGREVRWFLNPGVGTNLREPARAAAQREAPVVVPFVGGAAGEGARKGPAPVPAPGVRELRAKRQRAPAR